MKLSIKDGAFYADNVFLCYCEAGNGRDDLPNGRFEAATQFSHVHGKVLCHAYDFGWIGADRGCDLVLGGVRSRTGVVPSQNSLCRLLALLEVSEGNGFPVWLEIEK